MFNFPLGCEGNRVTDALTKYTHTYLCNPQWKMSNPLVFYLLYTGAVSYIFSIIQSYFF